MQCGLSRLRTAVKGKKVKVDTCYCAAYMSQTQDQQRFTISEVAADWNELMVPQHIMRPSIVRPSEQLDPRCIMTDIPTPQSATQGLHPVARKLLLIAPTHGGMARLS